MTKLKCEICGVKTCRVGDKKRIFMAKFPLDEERCKEWVKVTGNEDLAYVPIEKLHQLKYICEKHFRSKDFNKKKTKLRRNAIPSLHIPATPLPDEILVDFPLHIYTSYIDDPVPIKNTKAIESISSNQNENKLQKGDQASNARDPSPEFSNEEDALIHSPEFSNEEEALIHLPEFLNGEELLNASVITSVKYGPNIQKDVASSFEHIATNGMDEETRKDLIKKHPIPKNCTEIHAPSLTPEIKATVTDQVIKQDEAIEVKQKQLEQLFLV